MALSAIIPAPRRHITETNIVITENNSVSTAIHRSITNPSLPGTDENEWQNTLADAPSWIPPDGPLLIVSPHPDDEVLGAGGLIHTWKALGRRVTVVSVTDGEAAYPQYRRLGQIRREELKEALQVLSDSPVLVVRLGIPDGRVAEHGSKLRSAVFSLLDKGTTVFVPYEQDGHPDHDAAGRVCAELARVHGFTLARYPIWAWRHADPRTMSRVRWGKFILSTTARASKANALLCFSSQLFPYRRPPMVPDHAMAYFTRPYEAFLL
jgi:LmbE family N-acetylglucosaminyl deacetylase